MENEKLVLGWRQTILPSLSLFTSIGTLLCCALPALLVTLGMGSVLAGLISSAPWVTAISTYKAPLFIGSGILIILATFAHWQSRNAPCPADPLKAKACAQLRKVSAVTLVVATILYLIGVFFAFIAVHVFF